MIRLFVPLTGLIVPVLADWKQIAGDSSYKNHRGKGGDQKYAENVLESMMDVDALTPNLWHLEAISVLLGAEKRGEISLGEIERFISQLENLRIHVDPLTAHQAFSRTLVLSREYNISSYDASYLELAMREGLPLSSLDKKTGKSG